MIVTSNTVKTWICQKLRYVCLSKNSGGMLVSLQQVDLSQLLKYIFMVFIFASFPDSNAGPQEMTEL